MKSITNYALKTLKNRMIVIAPKQIPQFKQTYVDHYIHQNGVFEQDTDFIIPGVDDNGLVDLFYAMVAQIIQSTNSLRKE